MSLTSELSTPTSPIAQFMARRLPLVANLQEPWRRQMAQIETIRPVERLPYSTSGTALNYRIHYALGDSPPVSAMAGAGMWAGKVARTAAAGDPLNLRNEFFAHVSKLVANHRPWTTRLGGDACEQLCRACWTLAIFEQLYRAGTAAIDESPLWHLPAEPTVADLLGLAPDVAVLDLCSLTDAAWDPFLSLFTDVPCTARHLGPTLAGSGDVGGADADFILGSCCVEMKSTVQPQSLKRDWIYQIVGYVLLDYDNRYGIDEVALYMARQATLVRWPLELILRRLSPVNDARPLAQKPPVDLGALRAEFRGVVAATRRR